MSSELVSKEFAPYLDEVLHRQDSYESIKEVVELLAGKEVKISLVNNSSRGQGYSEGWKPEETLNVEDVNYVGYNLEMELAEKDETIDFRTALLSVEENEDSLDLIFPHEKMVGQRMIVSVLE